MKLVNKTCILILALLPWALLTGAADPLSLQPIYRLKSSERLVTDEDLAYERALKADLQSIAFKAVCTNYWHAGLVPIFLVQKSNRFELRRLPQRGKENASEPLCFALPRRDEISAPALGGRWECHAIRSSGSKEWFGMELAVDGTNVAGRFDQNTDFRFAFIIGGIFVSNRLTLRVEYHDQYELHALLEHRKTSGRWRRLDGSEEGPWEATHSLPVVPPVGEEVELYEWRRAKDEARKYLLAQENPGTGWTQTTQALCRVWRPESFPKVEEGALRAPSSIPQTPANPQRNKGDRTNY